MRWVIGADEERAVVDHLERWLLRNNFDIKRIPVGPWADVALTVAKAVADGSADCGVVLCWTGTGVSIAANKVDGVRAALCTDAVTARGARQWNDANVLALSLRLLSEPLVDEILEAWTQTRYEGAEAHSLTQIASAEASRRV